MHDLSREEVRNLVQTYYAIQDFRMESRNQVRALEADEKRASFLDWVAENMRIFEDDIKRALDYYTEIEPTGMGRWAKAVYGIGPVISAGLLAHIDIAQSPYFGHLERYAGLDPKAKWIGKGAEKIIRGVVPRGTYLGDAELVEICTLVGRNAARVGTQIERVPALYDGAGGFRVTDLAKLLARRPWNAALKTLVWKIGQSFVKFSGRDQCFYGKHYLTKKLELMQRNAQGDFAERAAQKLRDQKIADKDARERLESGRLTDGHVIAMASRYAAKLFLHHWFDEAYRRHHGKEPPLPYILAHSNGQHTRFIAPPEITV